MQRSQQRKPSATSTPQAGLFGTPSPQGSSLFQFGASPSEAVSGGLFGQPMSGGLFGSPPLREEGGPLAFGTAPPSGSTGLFGQASSPGSTGLFGQSMGGSGTGLFGQVMGEGATSDLGDTPPADAEAKASPDAEAKATPEVRGGVAFV